MSFGRGYRNYAWVLVEVTGTMDVLFRLPFYKYSAFSFYGFNVLYNPINAMFISSNLSSFAF